MNNRDKKNVMIVALLVAVVFMSVGYALLSTQLEISGTSTIVEPVWDVKIASISSTETEGYGENIYGMIENRYTAKFSAQFQMPGDKVTYIINVKNEGTLDAVLNSIKLSPDNYADGFIVYSVEGIEAGEVLKKGDSKMFQLVATYNEDMLTKPTEQDLTKDVTLMLDYVQK